ncbi:histidine kinase [Demequina sp. SYSU T00192]|uniref:histidine kinase n=1 Tax=Demequina litoralis TaxID=3051660 RepID=A0ABT8G9W5_9MICO|nr:histidine kinase [Demequina sp. SYSU T00192]MDN4475934.1 histidine kinase [Demequina sp. SYSU T00192]
MTWGLAVLALAAGALAAVLGARLAVERRRARALAEERTQEGAAALALAASNERARIAREMHDVVAHTLSVVVAQADGGRFAGRTDPAAALTSLDTIADVGRSALAEMRALLGVLRDGDGDAALGPQPSLADIPALVASMREGGLEVSYVTTGTPRPLPIGAGLAAYRIVQEALTNVLKHAGPRATAFVQLRWEDDALALAVSDDGRGAAARGDGAGLGIAGMAERATVFGGMLTAGPRAGGGFLVRARLPLTPRTSPQMEDA